MFFEEWSGLLRVLVVGMSACLSLLLLLRRSGTRTQSQLHAFDFVLRVALGSALATVLVSSDSARVKGLVAMDLLVYRHGVLDGPMR